MSDVALARGQMGTWKSSFAIGWNAARNIAAKRKVVVLDLELGADRARVPEGL